MTLVFIAGLAALVAYLIGEESPSVGLEIPDPQKTDSTEWLMRQVYPWPEKKADK